MQSYLNIRKRQSLVCSLPYSVCSWAYLWSFAYHTIVLRKVLSVLVTHCQILSPNKKDIATSRLDMIQIDGMRVMYANEVVYSNLIKLVQYRLQIAAHQYLPAISHVEAYK